MYIMQCHGRFHWGYTNVLGSLDLTLPYLLILLCRFWRNYKDILLAVLEFLDDGTGGGQYQLMERMHLQYLMYVKWQILNTYEYFVKWCNFFVIVIRICKSKDRQHQRPTTYYNVFNANKLYHQPLNLFVQAVFMYWLRQTIN
jgi:hypothetical protein